MSLVAILINNSPVLAQSNPEDFYQDLLSSDKNKNTAAEAQNKKAASAAAQASSLLNKRPSKLQIDIPKIERISRTSVSKPKTKNKASATEPENLDSAPFGLLWKANIEEIKELGVILSPIEEKDYVNSFSATHLPKAPKGFRDIYITFGIEDELWRILAIGEFINDEPDASKVLKEYRKYVRLLSQKYGNQQENFDPKMTSVEKKVMVNGREQTVTEQKPEPIGNPEFLSQLQNGEATLYSTFEGNNIGAALAINVDGDGKSYIIIDYKNIKILQDREKEALDIL